MKPLLCKLVKQLPKSVIFLCLTPNNFLNLAVVNETRKLNIGNVASHLSDNEIIRNAKIIFTSIESLPNIHKKLNLENRAYNILEPVINNEPKQNKYFNIKEQDPIPKNIENSYILINDEFDSINHNWESETTNIQSYDGIKYNNWKNKFIEVFTNAYAVINLDAYINRNSIKLMSKMCNRECIAIINHNNPFNENKVNIYSNERAVYQHIKSNLEANRKIVISCALKVKVKMLEVMIANYGFVNKQFLI